LSGRTAYHYISLVGARKEKELERKENEFERKDGFQEDVIIVGEEREEFETEDCL
jgi:hypothetical protein